MPIPNAALAVVPSDKVTEYLLNPTHLLGGSKAQWLLSLGYDRARPEQLANDLLELVHHAATFATEESAYGVKYTVPGQILTPSGRSVNIVTIWIAEPGECPSAPDNCLSCQETVA